MKRQVIKKIGILLLLWTLIILGQVFFNEIPAFRSFYILKLYPFIEGLRLFLLGWPPLSIGDVLYVLAGVWLLLGIIELVRLTVHFRRMRQQVLSLLLKGALVFSISYLLFIWGWGYNYQYDRVQKVFAVRHITYSDHDLRDLCVWMAEEVNQYHRQLAARGEDSSLDKFLPVRKVMSRAPAYYASFVRKYPSMEYKYESIKPSMFGYLMNYAGITGYFNPFTGEAQINTTAPLIGLPFTACHEIAHQSGFAAEDDANFVGYLVATTASDPYFRYSAHFEILPYALRALASRDSVSADSIWNKMLLPGVRKDYQAVENFYREFHGPANRMLTVFYDQYLKANDQEFGIKSYSRVVNLLMDYFGKTGFLKSLASEQPAKPHLRNSQPL